MGSLGALVLVELAEHLLLGGGLEDGDRLAAQVADAVDALDGLPFFTTID